MTTEFRRLYCETSLSRKEISNRLGVSLSTMAKWRRAMGLPSRDALERTTVAKKKAEFEQLYRTTTLTAADLAAKLGIKRTIAYQWKSKLRLADKPRAPNPQTAPSWKRAEFQRLYTETDQTLEQITKTLGVVRSSLIRWRVQMGLKCRTQPVDRSAKRAEFETLYRDTPMGAKAIAAKLGIPRHLAMKWRRALGVTTKPVANGVASREKREYHSNRYGSAWWRECAREQNVLASMDDCWGRLPEIVRARQMDNYYANHEVAKARARANAKRIYHERKNDQQWMAKSRARSRDWNKRNPDRKRVAHKKWRTENPEKWAVYRRRQQAKPEHKTIHNLRRRLRDLVKRGKAKGVGRNGFIGCAPAFLVYYLGQRFADGMTWENYGTAWQIDHVLPCASFDLTKPREVKKCFHYTNLQPLWKKDNAEKSAKVLRQELLAI